MEAYKATTDRFNLKAKQRNQLDVADEYPLIMEAAKAEHWAAVAELLEQAGIMVPLRPDTA